MDSSDRFVHRYFENLDGQGMISDLTAPVIANGIPFFFNDPPTTYQIRVADLDGDDDDDLLTSFDGVVFHENRLIGDSNDDGRFNSSDLVSVFVAGEYEDNIPNNSTFDTGNWNGDGDFTTADLVFAFQSGNYEFAARQDADFAGSVDWMFAQDANEKNGAAFVA